MSKLAVFLTVPVVAGVVVWNVSLQSDVADLREQIAARRDAPAVRSENAETSKSAAARARDPAPRAAPQAVTELADRIAALEARVPETPPADAGGAGASTAGGAPAAPVGAATADVVRAFQTDAFKGAVGRVLEERDEQRRKERMERAAEARARFLLRDLTVTDQQRADVQKALVASMEKVDRIRQDESIPDEQRRQDVQAAQQEQVESLAAVLDAQTMEKVRERSTGGARFRQDGTPRRRGGGGQGGQPGGGRSDGQ